MIVVSALQNVVDGLTILGLRVILRIQTQSLQAVSGYHKAGRDVNLVAPACADVVYVSVVDDPPHAAIVPDILLQIFVPAERNGCKGICVVIRGDVELSNKLRGRTVRIIEVLRQYCRISVHAPLFLKVRSCRVQRHGVRKIEGFISRISLLFKLFVFYFCDRVFQFLVRVGEDSKGPVLIFHDGR